MPVCFYCEIHSLAYFRFPAPEILQADYYIGPEVDLWSCGAVLYMMLTGSVPFAAETRAEVFSNIRNANIHIPSHWSTELQHLLRRLLTPNSLRYAPWHLE